MSAALEKPPLPVGDPIELEALARLCKAAADPRRLQILRSLARDSFGVLELCRVFGMRQPAMSHHLKVLAEAGLVSRRREGNSIFYRRSHRMDKGLNTLMASLFATVDRIEPQSRHASRLESIQYERAASSEAFFAANADKFAAQQELIAAPEHYLEPLLQLVDGLDLASPSQALELGPGTGWLLPHLAQRVDQLVAIDSSAEMLESARRHCLEHGLHSVRFEHGDHRLASRLELRTDLAVVNMVLHHTPSPAAVIAALGAALRPGGALLVCELDSHDQSWVRDACGDLWLGFSAEDLEAWSHEAGLAVGERAFLALRNGFQVQLHTFYAPNSEQVVKQ